MNRNKYLLLVLALSLLIITTGVSAAAQPILPDKFYGSVKLGGMDAPAGTRIDVKLSGIYLKSYELENAGTYVLYVTEGGIGNPIEFLIEGMPVGSSVRTGGLRENLNLSLSSTNSLSQNFTSENMTIDFHGKDTVSIDMEIITKTDVVNESITVSLYEDSVLAGFSIGDGESHIKSITVDMNSSIVDYAILKIYYTADEVNNFKKNSLKVYFYNENTGEWEEVPDQGINTEENYLWANVTHFSSYGLFGKELFCGDGICSNEIGESCSSCSQDCGICSTGGGGGGPPAIETCEENWVCSEWSECFPEGIQTRDCMDLDECGTEESMPEEMRSCEIEGAGTCVEGSRVCAGDMLAECINGTTWEKVETCEWGCENGACKPKPEETKEGFVGLITGIPVAFWGIIFLIIIILAGAAYWKVRK